MTPGTEKKTQKKIGRVSVLETRPIFILRALSPGGTSLPLYS